MNLWELASRPIIPVFTPTYLRDKFCLGGKEKKKRRRRKGGGRSLLFSLLAEINFSQGDKAIFIF